MGTVYEAWQRSLQRVVALKVLARHVSATPKAIVRFQREAQAAAKLHHTNIVPIFAQAETGGVYYYAMEYIEGSSLNQMIAGLRQGTAACDSTVDLAETVALPPRGELDGPPAGGSTGSPSASGSGATFHAVSDTPSLATIASAEHFRNVAVHMADIADALDYAHQRGVIHRDIKPHNLLVGGDGRMRISDFGLARLAEQPGVTVTGEVLGSPLYMSPEQINGDPENVDHRADIYSLGATIYEWLTLSPPFPGETRERVISKILSSEASPPRTHNAAIPLDLETICMKAIERNRERRYQTAAELRDDLRRFLLSQPIVARRLGLGGRAVRLVRRHQLASLGAAAAVIALSLTWALFAKQRQKTEVVTQARESEATILYFLTQPDFVNQLPLELRGTLKMAQAAMPVVQEMVQSQPASALLGTLTANESSGEPPVGSPAALGRRLALEFYESAAGADWPPAPSDDENIAHLHEAVRHWRDGQRETATALLAAYLEVRPTDFNARQLHALLCAQLGRYEEMTLEAEQLLSVNSLVPHGYMWRGLALLLLGQGDKTLEDVHRAVALNGRSPWVRLLHGLASIQTGRAGEALPSFDEVLRTSPDSATARLGRAIARLGVGRYVEAMSDATDAIRTEPGSADAYTIRGDCFMALGDYAAAASDFQQAMSLAGRTRALGLRFVAALLQRQGAPTGVQPGVEDAAGARPQPNPADAEEDGSGGAILDWFSRKIWPRSSGSSDKP